VLGPVQCPDHPSSGCTGPPKWPIRWDMAGSGYIYCYQTCPVEWLANNRNLGVYAGMVGVDHYWTKQGMPCINGIPQEFAMQDAYTIQQKKIFPQVKILQYRITDAVPYAEVIHDKMVSDPTAFVRWTHPPNNNGTICMMPYVEQDTTGFNCSWEVRAAAYDWSQQRVQDWYLETIIKPVMKYADGVWLDGDGPDNGAWMCSGNWNYDNIPKPYPALNPTEIASFCDGESKVAVAAQKWLIANGGYEYNCISFITSDTILPKKSDSKDTCASKLIKLDHRPADGEHTSIVLYGDRIQGSYTDAEAAQAVAVFMLTRDAYWFFWVSRCRQT